MLLVVRMSAACGRTLFAVTAACGEGERSEYSLIDTVRGAGRDESTTRIRAALAELLEPDKAELRRSPEQIAALFLGLLFAQPRTEDEPDLTAQELVRVFLHGALSGAPSERAAEAAGGHGPGRSAPPSWCVWSRTHSCFEEPERLRRHVGPGRYAARDPRRSGRQRPISAKTPHPRYSRRYRA